MNIRICARSSRSSIAVRSPRPPSRLASSQPAVTMQLQALESELGTILLDRRYRRVDLTEAGCALEPHARRIIAEVERARGELVGLSGEVGGVLEIAASTTPGVYVVPGCLAHSLLHTLASV